MPGFAYKNYLNAVYPLLCAEFPFPLLEFPSLYFFFLTWRPTSSGFYKIRAVKAWKSLQKIRDMKDSMIESMGNQWLETGKAN